MWNRENRPFPSCVKILWLDIPEHLSVNLESIQKRALTIDFPDFSYDEALTFSGFESLEKRRLSKSRRLISAWRSRTCHEVISVPYDLRSGHEKSFRPYIRIKKENDFITFEFLD